MLLKVSKNSLEVQGNKEECKGMMEMLAAYYGPKKKVIEVIKEEAKANGYKRL